jgi:hypothetical protein
MTPRTLATVMVEEADEGSFVVLRTDRGAEVRYGPFSADGVEAAISHLGSALAMTAMRCQTVLRGADFGGTLHRRGLPPERPDKAGRSRRRSPGPCRGTGSAGRSSPTCSASCRRRPAWINPGSRTCSRRSRRRTGRSVSGCLQCRSM